MPPRLRWRPEAIPATRDTPGRCGCWEPRRRRPGTRKTSWNGSTARHGSRGRRSSRNDRSYSSALSRPAVEGSGPTEILLERVRGPEHRRLIERLGDQLEADGKRIVRRQSAGHAYRGVAGEVDGNGEHIRQIHGERVGSALSEPERGGGRSGAGDEVDGLVGPLEVLNDQGAHFLRLAVVGVVVAGRKRVGPEHDPALHFGAETLRPGARGHRHDVVGARGPVAVAN